MKKPNSVILYIRADGCEVFVRQDGTIKIYSNSEYEHKLGKRHCEQLLEALERVVCIQV